MKIDESIIVTFIIYKKSFKSKKKDISLKELGRHFRIKEEIKLNNLDDQFSKVLMLDDGNKNSRKKERDETLLGNNNKKRKQKRKDECFNCNKSDHFKRNCHFLKKERNNGNLSAKFVDIISKVFIVEDNTK